MDCTEEHIEEQRILSFCYGYGGLEKGIRRIIPTRTVAYVEIEAFQNFNLVAAMESGLVDQAPIWTNLKTFDAKPFHNRIHGIVGGYPCQGESLAGKRKLWRDERFLWPHIERAIIDTEPVWCFFENVSGHLSGSFPYVLKSLQDLGYAVEAEIFTAEEIGAPHQRERVFILAMANTYCKRIGKATKLQNSTFWKQSSNEFIVSSREKLGNTNSFQSQACFKRQKKMQHRGTSDEFSNTTSKRNRKSSKEHETNQFIKSCHQWPAKRGHKQFEWEHPRTIEPGLGCTVNGYNFRTELLRQFGNGVVEQTAALAFRTLLTKHLNNEYN